MAEAKRICFGEFGRVSVLELDRELVTRAHPQAHVVVWVGGHGPRWRSRGGSRR